MRAVWSFWSKPFHAGSGWHWREPLHHLLAWGLSLRLARAHYPDTVLITDTPGKTLLVNQLGLNFAHVSTELDRLRDADPAWWALGKLVAYSLQDKPFVHLDTDVFLWRPLPERITRAPVLAQYLEPPCSSYEPWIIENALATARLDPPVEWQWYRSLQEHSVGGVNCGILGGTNISFIQHYARLALDLLQDPRNSAAYASIPFKDGLNPVVEQFVLLACLDFHRLHPDKSFGDVDAKYLFPSSGRAFSPNEAARLGFTHLMGGAKADANVTRRLEERLRQEDGRFYEHCVRVTRG